MRSCHWHSWREKKAETWKIKSGEVLWWVWSWYWFYCWDHDSLIIVWQDQQTSKNHGDTHRNSSAEVDEGNNRQDVGHHLLKATLRWWFRTITAVLPATEMRTNATFSKVWVILTSRAPPIRKFTCRLPGSRLNRNINNQTLNILVGILAFSSFPQRMKSYLPELRVRP